MSAEIKLDLGPWELSIKKALIELTKATSLLRRAFAIVGPRDLVSHFEQETGPNGPWKKRDPKTNAAYDRIYAGLRRNRAAKKAGEAPPLKESIGGIPRSSFRSSNKILQLTGNLKRSMLNPQIQDVGADAIKVTSLVDYSGRHDDGLDGMPQREFMYLTDEAQETMSKVILDSLAKGFD